MPRRPGSVRPVPDASNLQAPGQIQDAELDDRHSSTAEHEPSSNPAAVPAQEPVQDVHPSSLECSSDKLSRSASQQQTASSPGDQPSNVHGDDAAASSHAEGQFSAQDLQQQTAPGEDVQQPNNSASSSQADEVGADFSTATPVLRAGSSIESPASSLPSAEEDDEACVQHGDVAEDQVRTISP